MARLILLNGAPGVGKTTVGDTDRDVTASYLATRDLAVAMARTHLVAGHDAVVPQYLGRPEFVERLAATAADVGATFVELALVTDAATGRARFDARGDVPPQVGADESWEQMHARLTALLADRAHVVRVDASGDLDATVGAVGDVLRRPQTGR